MRIQACFPSYTPRKRSEQDFNLEPLANHFAPRVLSFSLHNTDGKFPFNRGPARNS